MRNRTLRALPARLSDPTDDQSFRAKLTLRDGTEIEFIYSKMTRVYGDSVSFLTADDVRVFSVDDLQTIEVSLPVEA